MTVIFITEYAAMAPDAVNRTTPMPQEPPITTQTVAIGVEAKSSAFNANTAFVRLHSDAICSVLVGDGVTATTSSPRMAQDQTEYFGVKKGAGHLVSVISNT